MSTNNTIGIIYIIVAMATFSVHDSILKFIFQKVSLYEIYFGRTFIAATLSTLFLLILKKKNIVKKLSRTQKSDIYCTGIQILNPKKINDKIKPTEDFNILWKKLIKIRQLYVSDVMPKKWYTVDNLDNLKKLKKIFK